MATLNFTYVEDLISQVWDSGMPSHILYVGHYYFLPADRSGTSFQTQHFRYRI